MHGEYKVKLTKLFYAYLKNDMDYEKRNKTIKRRVKFEDEN
jgi:hypothetical protein